MYAWLGYRSILVHENVVYSIDLGSARSARTRAFRPTMKRRHAVPIFGRPRGASLCPVPTNAVSTTLTLWLLQQFHARAPLPSRWELSVLYTHGAGTVWRNIVAPLELSGSTVSRVHNSISPMTSSTQNLAYCSFLPARFSEPRGPLLPSFVFNAVGRHVHARLAILLCYFD